MRFLERAVTFNTLLVCLLLYDQTCIAATEHKTRGLSPKASARQTINYGTGSYGTGSLFQNWALDAETNLKLPLVWQKWNDECDNKISGLTLTPINGNLYYFYTGAPRLNWYAARDWCTARGMDLTSLETVEEATAVIAYVTQLLGGEPSTASQDAAMFYIGLNDLGTPAAPGNTFWWPTTGLPPVYAPWISGAAPTGVGQDCASIAKRMGSISVVGFDAPTTCAVLGRFICELKSPCRETLLVRYYLDQKLEINNYRQAAQQLFGTSNVKNFQNILFNTNPNAVG